MERLINSGRVCSTGSYSARFRAKDSVLTLKSVKGFFTLRRCVIFQGCDCRDCSCSCVRECLLIGCIAVQSSSGLRCSYWCYNTAKHITIVSNSQNTRVYRPTDVDCKCILMHNDTHEMHVMILTVALEH